MKNREIIALKTNAFLDVFLKEFEMDLGWVLGGFGEPCWPFLRFFFDFFGICSDVEQIISF